jgi:DNA-binding CsgD family transcriptional regulator
VLRVSAAHVYLTYPFVLSWSLLEAMACSVPIVASNTAPVREVVTGGVHGRLVGFFDTGQIAGAVTDELSDTTAAVRQRERARRDAQRYGLREGLAGYDGLLAEGEPHEPQASTPIAGAPDLTASERELLRLVSAGHSTEEIAAVRHRSPATVRNQLSGLYQKLGVSRRSAAMAKALVMNITTARS